MISVVIVNYNTYNLTCQCIESVLSTGHSVEKEIILVDNASTERNANDFLLKYPDIVLVRSDSNLGFSKGNNLGIEHATGEYILLLNSDAVLTNNAIGICSDLLDDDSTVAVVTGCLAFPNGVIQHNCQRFPGLRYKIFELLRLQKILPRKFSGQLLLGFFFDYNRRIYADWVWGTFFMFRRNLIPMLPKGKLNDQFFMYGEDMQWCYDFRKLGYRIAFEPKAKIIHHMGMSGAKKNEMMRDNLNTFLRQHYSPIKIWLLRGIDRLLALGR